MTSRDRALRIAAQKSKTALQGARSSLVRALGSTSHPEQAAEPSTPLGDHPRGRNSRLRANIARLVSERHPALAEYASHIALALHPWPDFDLDDEAQMGLLAEMSPIANLPHSDAVQVLADRLLRLTEQATDQNLPRAWVSELNAAARRLCEAPTTSAAGVEVDGAADPLGLGLLDDARREPVTPPPAIGGSAIDPAVLAPLIKRVCMTGSLDVGVVLGDAPTGTSVATLINATGLPARLSGLDEWLDACDARSKEVLLHRALALEEPQRLQDFASRWGLVRERVRQVEAEAIEVLDNDFGAEIRRAGEALTPLRDVVLPTRRFVDVTRLLAHWARNRDAVAAAITRATGPWVRIGEWTCHESLRGRIDEATKGVLAIADPHGLLPSGAEGALANFFCIPDEALDFLQSAAGIVELSGYLAVRDSQRSRVAAALRRLGRPATKGEIATEAGVDDDQRVGSTLSALPGIVRADKERWALAEHVDDPYGGIAAEINQRIDANFGSCAVAPLLHELPQRFGVTESSVQAYLKTPAFVVESGFVRRADPGTYEAAHPSKWSDVFARNGFWGQRVRVESRHFEGYSLRVRFDVAYANGLRPDDDLKVPVHGDGAVVSVIWRAHDAARAIDVGRVADVLAALGIDAGMQVLVTPTRDAVFFERWTGDMDAPAPDAKSDSAVDHRDPLFDLLEGS